MSKKRKSKLNYDEKQNKRKPKAKPICKVHKGKHQYTILHKDYGFCSFNNSFKNKTVVMKCECGKQNWTTIPVKSGEKLKKLVEYCQNNPDIDFKTALSTKK